MNERDLRPVVGTMMNHTNAPSNHPTYLRRRGPDLRRRGPDLRRLGLATCLAVILVVAAACSSSSSTATKVKSGSTGSTGSSASTTSLKLGSTMIAGVGTVLTGPNGHTLYYRTKDTSTTSTCTGSCATLWPPLVVPSGSTPVLPSGVSGSVSTAMRTDGSAQLTYDGHLVYYDKADTAAGQDKGQGMVGTWFVVKASPASGAAGQTTTPMTTTTMTTTTKAGGGGGGVGF